MILLSLWMHYNLEKYYLNKYKFRIIEAKYKIVVSLQ